MEFTTPIFDMFAKSPIGPMQEHIEITVQCVQKLEPFLSATFAKDWEKVEAIQKEINDLETKADKLKQDLRTHLPKNLFLPIARADVLNIIMLQDRIANKAEDISGLILGRKMEFPEELQNDFQQFLLRATQCVQQACKAINELDELLSTGFRGKEVTRVEHIVQELDYIERETDEMQVNLRRRLFAIEDDLPPVHVIFLYKIIEWIGDLGDRAQSVGGQLSIVMAD